MNAQHLVLRIQRALARDHRHLVVSLLLRPGSELVSAVAVAPGRPPQLLTAGHSWLAAVTLGDEVVHLSRLPDPFATRGVRGEEDSGHRTSRCLQGRAVVAVPFASVSDLTRSRVHLLDLGPDRVPADPQRLAEELSRRLAAGSGVRTLDFEAITASPQWAAVGRLLGLGARPER